MSGPLLWFANRGSGVVVLALLTLSVVLGILSTARVASGRWPRFLTQGLHRNVALLSVAMLTVHVVTAVLDSYVDIRWYDAFVPVGAEWEPLWLGLGALAFDLILAVTVTSLVRRRMGARPWRGVHVTSYAAWGLGLLHGVQVGTDAGTGWLSATALASVVAVAAALLVRLATLVADRRVA